MAKINELDALANPNWLDNLNLYLGRLNEETMAHISNNKAHNSDSIVDSSYVSGLTVKDALNTLKTLHDNHLDSNMAHDSNSITYDGDIAGADDVKLALDIIQAQINSIVIGGTDVDPRVSQALVDSENETHATLKDKDDKWEGRVIKAENEIYESKKITIGPTTEDIIDIPNCREGQVSDIGLEGNTRFNLVPLFDSGKWNLHSNVTVDSPTKITLSANSSAQYSYISISVKQNTDYTLSAIHKAYIAIYDEGISTNISGYTTNSSTTFNSGSNDIVTIVLDNRSLTGTFTFENVQLEEGTEVKPFITGIKSTILNGRLRTQNVNLFDGKSWSRIGNTNVYTSSVTSAIVKIQPNTTYTIKRKTMSNRFYIMSGRFDNGFDTSMSLVTNTAGNFSEVPIDTTYSITTGGNDTHLNIYLSNEGYNPTFELMVNKGDIALPYNPHEGDKTYILGTNEDGEILEMYSLPNGVADKIEGNKVNKNISNKYDILSNNIVELITSRSNLDIVRIDLPADANKNFDSFSIDGKVDIFGLNETTADKDDSNYIGYYATSSSYSGTIYLYVTKGQYADLTTAQASVKTDYNLTSLIYQFAPEHVKTYDLIGYKGLKSYDGYTRVVWEPVIQFEAIANENGQIEIPHVKYPIDYVETVEEKIINNESVSYVKSSYSQVNDTTIGGLTYGKKYRVTYFYPTELSTSGEKTITVTVNVAANLQQVMEIQQRLKEELGSVWMTLLPLADKELQMYMITEISTPASATSEDIANKVNEILSVWK